MSCAWRVTWGCDGQPDLLEVLPCQHRTDMTSHWYLTQPPGGDDLTQVHHAMSPGALDLCIVSSNVQSDNTTSFVIVLFCLTDPLMVSIVM